MFVQRTATAVARRAAFAAPAVARRAFSTSMLRLEAKSEDKKVESYKTLSQVRTVDDLFGPGAPAGTTPTDIEQSTGIERLEILGKLEGKDIFDMTPLDSSRKGTMENPIMVKSGGEEQYAGCTGSPADSHVVLWLGMSKERPIERCPECGSVYKMEYVGPEDHGHDHHHHDGPEEPKTMADYIKPEYRYI